jgi:hypothetical protein
VQYLVIKQGLGTWGFCQTVPVSQTSKKLIRFIFAVSFCIYLTHIFFLQAFARWGTPGGQRACAAGSAADFRADYLLLRRLYGFVSGACHPAMADIESYTRTLCPKSFSSKP